MNLGNPIASGNTANIYLSEKKIIKVFKDFLPESESINEAKKQNYAHSCGLPVPKIYQVTKINGKQAIIMEYAAGETLGNLLAKEPAHFTYYLNMSIDEQQKIHRIIPTPLESMHDKLTNQIKSVNLLNSKQKLLLLKKLDSFSFEPRLCHGDFHLYNLIKTKDRVVVIDWIDCSAGDKCADVYRTYLLYTQVSTVLAEQYIKLYCKKSGMKMSDIFKWAPIVAAARLAENVSSEDSGRLLAIIEKYDFPSFR
ncbi:phosphotransferase family protein [Cytobacillus gottheilii]|uniref:phosphotransferase family protein n=1 Tax=Cytobacillus gottheilii TaxID=859144 RepID=UPI0009BBBE50|nr:phosphotransferase [Cytobacillus gottheilii]